MSVYDIVTQAIIEKLESIDASNWEKPWFNIGVSPYNAVSKQAYRGMNFVLLSNNPYKSAAYASFKQWQEKGCQVKKGEKSHIVVFWKFSDYENEETGESGKSVLCRYYRVFNSEQVEGEYARKIESEKLAELIDHDPIEAAENLVNHYVLNERLPVKHSDRAYYSQSAFGGNQYIGMPLIGQFKSPELYYSTFFHEMGHSTGANNRLARDMTGGFGSKTYAAEELVAELTSAMLCAAVGMDQKPRDDHAQYIKSWLHALKNDKRFIFSAASKAQKAADFIQESAANYKAFLDKPVFMAAE